MSCLKIVDQNMANIGKVAIICKHHLLTICEKSSCLLLYSKTLYFQLDTLLYNLQVYGKHIH